MQRLLTGLLGVSLLLAACGDDDADADRAAVTSIPDDTTTSSTTTAKPQTVAVDVIPQDTALITEDYVEQVLNHLFEVSNRALVKTMEAGVVDESVIALVEATTASEQGRTTLNGLAELAANDFAGIVDEPSGLRAHVTTVVAATPNCIAAEIDLDSSGVTGTDEADPEGTRGFVELHAATGEQKASGHNPTAWVLAGLPATTDGSTPPFSCGA